MKFIVFIFTLLFLAACGGGTGLPPGKLTYVSSTPVKNSMDAPLKGTISVSVQEDLDFSTAKVHLMPAPAGDQDHEMSSTMDDADMQADIIAGNANLSGPKTITFTPNNALSPGTRYHFHVAGLKLKNGQLLPTGTDTLEFMFTTAHSHEAKRVYYGQATPNVVACTVLTAVSNNERTMRQYVEDGCKDLRGEIRRAISGAAVTMPITTHYKQTSHQPTVAGAPVERYTEYGGQPGSGTVILYEKLVGQNGVDRVLYKGAGTQADLATDWWTDSEMHGMHKISYSYRSAADGGTTFTASNPKTGFNLNSASLMEMNHKLQVPTAGMFPHRHIFYSDLGSDGKIDFDAQGNPTAASGDIVRVYHTREYDAQGRRVRDWTWKGNANGGTVTFNTNQDLATTVRVYEFDETTGLRIRRFSYESANGMTQQAWNTALTSLKQAPTNTAAVGVTLHDFRDYTNNVATGVPELVTVYHECRTASQCTPAVHPVYGQLTNMYLEQKRKYVTTSNVTLQDAQAQVIQ